MPGGVGSRRGAGAPRGALRRGAGLNGGGGGEVTSRGNAISVSSGARRSIFILRSAKWGHVGGPSISIMNHLLLIIPVQPGGGDGGVHGNEPARARHSGTCPGWRARRQKEPV